MAKSPSITLIEKDFSTYTVTSSDTVLAVVGYATKGPIGKPTLVTSFKGFKQSFGYCSKVPYSYLAIKNAFDQGNQIIFTRVAETTGEDAATASNRVINNVVAQINGYREFTRHSDVPVGTSNYVNGDVYSFAVGASGSEIPVYVSSPASGGWYLDNIYSQIQSQFGATASFQEFSSKSVASTSSVYGFNVAINSANIFTDNTKNQSVLLNLTATDSIPTIVSKINEQFSSGTRAYHLVPTIAYSSHIGGAGQSYVFSLKLQSGGEATNVVVSTPTELGSLTAVAEVVNSRLIALGLNARCYFVSNALMFVSTTLGATSFIEVADLVDTTGYTGNLLLTLADTDWELSAETEVGQASQYGSSYALYYFAEQNASTLRLRICAGPSNIGAGKPIAITAPAVGNSLIDLFTTVNLPKDGRAAISGVTVSRDIATRKIRFTGADTTAPSVIAHTTGQGVGTVSLIGLLALDTAVAGTPAVTADASDKVIIESKETGSSTSRIHIVKSKSVDALTEEDVHSLDVYYDGELKETFTGFSLTLADDDFIEDVVNASVEEGGSEWITISTLDTDADGSIKFPEGTYKIGAANDESTDVAFAPGMPIGSYDYKVGTDGIPSIGGESLFVDALSTDGELANDELYNFHILITPDNITQVVQDTAIALADARADFIYLVDPPMGYTYSQVKRWHNGQYVRTSAVKSSYAAIYWSWLKEYDSENRAYVWCPPSVFMAAKLLEIDRLYNPWYAPAGESRGLLTVQDLEKSPSFSEREELYGDLNCVNPIVNFVNKGAIVYGQKTGLRANSALNRLNVRRMTIYAKKLIKQAMNSMLFEPNNTDSWQSASNLINSILEPIRQDNGIEQYKVIIDSSINTSDVIAQNIMKGVIKIVPTGTIEIIELNLNVYKTGTTIS